MDRTEEYLIRKLIEAEQVYRELCIPFDKLSTRIHNLHYTPRVMLHVDGSMESCGSLSAEAQEMIDELAGIRVQLLKTYVLPAAVRLENYLELTNPGAHRHGINWR